VYLYKGISECSLQFCLIAAAMIFLSPLVCNWLAGVSNASIQGRFERYIDRDLSKTNAPNMNCVKNQINFQGFGEQ
jgi:hypothetical protein